MNRALRRAHRQVPKKAVFGVAGVLGLVVVLIAEPRIALVTGAGLVTAALLWVAVPVRGLRRTLAQEVAQDERLAKEQHAAERAAARARKKSEHREARSEQVRKKEREEQREVKRLQLLLWHGNVQAGVEAVREFCADPTRSRQARFDGLMATADRYRSVGDEERARGYLRSALLTDPETATGERVQAAMAPKGRTLHFDVLHVSDFGLPGGTTGSNIQEIRAQTAAGMRTGILTTPFSLDKAGRPLNPKVIEVVDNDQVRFVHWSDRITCDLMIIRHPKVCERIIEDLPHIRAAHTMLVVNQTPFVYYGEAGKSEQSWDVGRVRAALGSRSDEYSWHPIGPAVRDTLITHHAAEMQGVWLAKEDWVEIIDLPAWQRAGSRTPDGKVRIGRHSRDAPGKWPETPEMLTSAYPAGKGYEVHVLGGANSAFKLLGKKPRGWRVRKFDTVPPLEFLQDLDVYSYFTSTDLLEAFGRAPLEAMAVGLPTIMPPSFKALFGDAGVYTEPSGVREEIELLMSDPSLYRAQVERAREVLRDRFSHEAHVRRLVSMGVGE